MIRLPSPSGGRARLLGLAVAATALVLPLTAGGAATAAPGGTPGSGGASADGTSQAGSNATVPVCLPEQAGFASCDSIRLADPSGWQGSRGGGGGGGGGGSGTPSGYTAANLESAYAVAGRSAPAGTTVAIVDAYADPNVASDLGVYRARMGLPALCGTGVTPCSGTFTIATPQGTPVGNTSWAQEISLDVDMVSAICPNCNILLEEAASNSYANLGGAVNDAAARGAIAISNSYGGSDSSSDAGFDASYYNHPNVAVTASSGDNGYGVEYPAASPDVIAVGGTHLSSVTGPETVWSGAGSGCSSYEPRPSWQKFYLSAWCPNGREVADVSADADPNTGVAVYDTYGTSGWLVFGGTSVASPIVASVFALAGNVSLHAYPAATLYASSGTSAFHLVTSGTNARRCPSGDYLCNAYNSLTGPSAGPWTTSTNGTPLTGNVWYSGPAGNGSPNGPGAF